MILDLTKLLELGINSVKISEVELELGLQGFTCESVSLVVQCASHLLPLMNVADQPGDTEKSEQTRNFSEAEKFHGP